MGMMASQITSLTIAYSTVIQAQIKENIKALRHWPLCWEFTGTGEFPAQRASNAENVSIWWRHRESQSSSHSRKKMKQFQEGLWKKYEVIRNLRKTPIFRVNTLWNIITNFRPHPSRFSVCRWFYIMPNITDTEVRKRMSYAIFGYIFINAWPICSILSYIVRVSLLQSADI